ncbi:hypothetical protein ACFQZE_00740 [Paenibacillus sp. GCM10027627]|uniref:hypothetical protein n=1 Tax=unclassified Paenibacillus TaxID=185978 RepID=UPI00363D6BCD
MDQNHSADRITMPMSQGDGGRQAIIHISSELMKNQMPSSILEPTKNICVVQDSGGKPMIFTIGTDAKFHLLKYDEASAVGFTAIDLSEGFPEYATARTFAVSQDNSGNITVCVALSKSNEAVTDLFIAPMISNDYSQVDWKAFRALAKPIAGADKGFSAEKMIIGTSDDGQAPLVIVSGHINGPKYYYQVDAATAAAVKCEFPQNVNQHPDSLMDMSIGYAFGQRGIFFLYKIGNSQTLECTTIANKMLGSMHYDYSPGNQKIPTEFQGLKYNCIATPTGVQSNPLLLSSDIFVGTNTGIYLFKDSKIKGMQKVTDKIRDVHEVIVKEDHENISIWAMCSPNKLYYIYGKKGRTYTWNDPVLFSNTAIHLAPIRSSLKLANELFLVNQDQSVTHYWQDPSSTLWQQRVLHFAGSDKCIEFNSFTTHINLTDERGKPLAQQKLQMTSSEWMYAGINGLTYSLDMDNAAEIETDRMGNVTIVQMTSDISSAIFHIEADFLDKTLNIYPNGRIHKGLQAIKSGDDLKNAVTSDGKPVLSSNLDQSTLNGVAQSVTQITGAGTSLMESAIPSSNTFVSVTDKTVKHTGLINVSHLPSGFAAGMKVKNGLLQPYAPKNEGHVLMGDALLGDVFDDIISFTGDLLHSIEHAFEAGIKYVRDGVTYLQEGVSFVIRKVEDGLMLALNLAGKVMNIALKTLGCVFKALNWVLKLVGIDLNKILEWLGRLLGWTDILETSDRLMDVFNGYLDSLTEAIPAVSAAIGDTLTALEHKIADPSIVAKFKDKANEKASAGGASIFQNPLINWPMYHIMHGNFFLGGGGSGGADRGDKSVIQQIESALKTLVQQEMFIAESAIHQMLETFVEKIPDMAIGDIFTKIFEIIAVASIETVKNGVEAILNLTGVLVKAMKDLLNEEVDVPILSTLLELIIGDRKLSLLRVFTLILAIPTRIIYRIATGDSLSNEQLFVPQKEDMSRLVTGSSANLPQASLLRGEKDYIETNDAIGITYAVARFFEMIFADINLIKYASGAGGAVAPDGGGISSTLSAKKYMIGESVFSGISIAMIMANAKSTMKEGETAINNYLLATICVSSARLVSVGIGAYKEEYKPWTRSFSVLCYLGLTIAGCVQFAGEDKNRSNNMRFSSNFFANLYKIVSSFPFKVQNPYGLVALGVTNSLFALTHISLVSARIKTDRDDRVTFRIV